MGEWTNEALNELDNLTIEEYGKLLKRFSQKELRSSNEALKQAETILSRRDGGSNQRTSSENSRTRAAEQEKQIEAWTKEDSCWVGKQTIFNKLNNNDIKEIIRNIAADYGNSEERISEVLQNLGVGPANMSGIDINAELKRGANDNALGYARDRRQRISEESKGYDNANREHSSTDRGEGGRETKGENEGIDLSGVQLIEGSDGTVYGWVDTTDKVLV